MHKTFALCLVLLGCEAPSVEAHRAETGPLAARSAAPITLTLETRSGTGTQGWSFERHELVPASAADLLVSAFDCGARGRWVSLESSTVEFCAGDEPECTWTQRIEVGGSSPSVAPGAVVHVRRGTQVLANLVLRERSETPSDWYEQPVPAFVVTLSIAEGDTTDDE